VCPYNLKFAQELSTPDFAPRPALTGKDARSLALELLAMSQSDFSAAFKGSPMKRAKLRGLKRNASVVLDNVGAKEDVPSLIVALEDADPLVRQHAAWALAKIGSPEALAALRARSVVEPGSDVGGGSSAAVSVSEG
jgi:epoxyqueuosine reductase